MPTVRAIRDILVARAPERGAGLLVWFAVVAAVFVIQRFGVWGLSHEGDAVVRQVIFFTTTAALIWLALKFRWLLGAWLIAAGIALNLLPIAAHEGLMPVAYETIRDSGKWPEYTEDDIGSQVANSKDVILWRDDIRFEPLSDRYVVTIPGYGPNIYSFGDFVIFGGVALAALQLIYLTFRPEPARTKADNGGVL